jgi:pilus assembly protein CpaC
MTQHTQSRLLGRVLGLALVAVWLAPAGTATQQATPDSSQAERLQLVSGLSMVMTTTFDITRVLVSDPTVADPVVIAERELVINGKEPGTTSLIIWGPGSRVHHQLIVEPAVTTLEQQIHNLFPGEDILVNVTDGAVILSGRVSSNDVMLRTGEIAQAALPELQVINMLQLPGGTGSQQVMLQVRFAEVNRSAMTEAGFSLFASRQGFQGRTTTQQFSAPDFEDQTLVFSDFLNLFFFQREEGIGGVLKALEERGWFESLAEPNLIAYNGQEASFLAGGEFPVPIVSGNTGNVSVEFKEFGVRLTFRPTIAGDVIRLFVEPEVSSLDFNNGVTLSGFRIPALTTRRASTEVELRDGQSFAIAGLLDTVAQEDAASIPVMSKIPIIGHLFRSKANREEQTELMVLITPRLVRPLNPDEVPPLPSIDRGRGGAGDPGTTGRGGRGGSGGSGGAANLGLGRYLLGGGGLVDAPAPWRETGAVPSRSAGVGINR